MSEIISEKGVALAGLIPAEVQLNTVYATGVLAANAAPEPAMAFVKFLADPANAEHWKHAGFEPAKQRGSASISKKAPGSARGFLC